MEESRIPFRGLDFGVILLVFCNIFAREQFSHVQDDTFTSQKAGIFS